LTDDKANGIFFVATLIEGEAVLLVTESVSGFYACLWTAIN